MRAIRTPGLVSLICALVLAIASSVSLLSLQSINITYTDFMGQAVTIDGNTVSQLRFGIWNNCYHILNGTDRCTNIGYAYSVQVVDAASGNLFTIDSGHSWPRYSPHRCPCQRGSTRLFSFSGRSFLIGCIRAIWHFTWAFFYLISFIVDMALNGYTKKILSGIEGGSKTSIGIGTWLGLAAMALVGFASFNLLMVRRQMMRPATPPPKKDPEG